MTGIKQTEHVSDHAVLRYLERVCGVDIEGIRRGLLTPEVKAAMRLKATSVTIQGVTFRLKDSSVVTVIETKRSPRLVRQVPLRYGVEIYEDSKEYV